MGKETEKEKNFLTTMGNYNLKVHILMEKGMEMERNMILKVN